MNNATFQLDASDTNHWLTPTGIGVEVRKTIRSDARRVRDNKGVEAIEILGDDGTVLDYLSTLDEDPNDNEPY